MFWREQVSCDRFTDGIPGARFIDCDVLKEGCSKGHALERWAITAAIAREQVMAIGDNYNDIEMLAFAGLPFIMGNASEELRRRIGWAVTLPTIRAA